MVLLRFFRPLSPRCCVCGAQRLKQSPPRPLLVTAHGDRRARAAARHTAVSPRALAPPAREGEGLGMRAAPLAGTPGMTSRHPAPKPRTRPRQTSILEVRTQTPPSQASAGTAEYTPVHVLTAAVPRLYVGTTAFRASPYRHPGARKLQRRASTLAAGADQRSPMPHDDHLHQQAVERGDYADETFTTTPRSPPA